MTAMPNRAAGRIADDSVTAPAGWIAWSGGDCPVPPHTPVLIRLGGETAFDENQPVRRADTWRWDHSARCHRANITHYRVCG